MSCVYILYSSKKQKFYIGSSREERAGVRIISHNAGRVRSTKSGKPWFLVYEELLESYIAARKRENFLKSGKGREWIKGQKIIMEGCAELARQRS